MVISREEGKLLSYTVIIAIASYFFIVFQSPNYFNPFNFIIYIISIIVVAESYYSVKAKGVKTYNIFGLFYFFSLFFNSLNISGHQEERTWFHLVLFVAAPLLMFFFLLLVERLKIPKIRTPSINMNINFIFIIFGIMYVLLSLYIISQVGLRIGYFMGVEGASKSGYDYSIPGFSGMQGVLKWTLVMLSPYVKKRYAIIAIFTILLFSVFLHVKRGDLIRILLFYIVIYIGVNYHKLFTVKLFLKVSIFVFVLLTSFVYLGELRNTASGGISDTSVRLDSRVNITSIDWVFAYIAINHDVALTHLDTEHGYTPDNVNFSLFKRLSDQKLIDSYNKRLEGKSIKGYNASTLMGPFINDFGYLFIIELLYYLFFLGLIIILFKVFYFEGVYFFAVTLIGLSFFGNYLLTTVMLSSLFFCLFISLFVLPKKKLHLKRAYA